MCVCTRGRKTTTERGPPQQQQQQIRKYAKKISQATLPGANDSRNTVPEQGDGGGRFPLECCLASVVETLTQEEEKELKVVWCCTEFVGIGPSDGLVSVVTPWSSFPRGD